jgi:hypothetical protein
MDAAVDLGSLSLARGGHLIVKRALAALAPGQRLAVHGSDPDLDVHLSAWCRGAGHELARGAAPLVMRGPAGDQRWADAERAGDSATAIVERPSARWGLAARSSLVEAGAPDLRFTLDEKCEIWSDDAPRLYAAALAAQWDPETAVPWRDKPALPAFLEDAVVQVMTFLIENETAALLVPARFLGRVHPHFREVMQLLAIQCADEARHVEVFTRRALLCNGALGVSAASGQNSLATLFDEPDFAIAMFLLSVLGEGSFLTLLGFLRRVAPDAVTARVTQLAVQDEARHVAFGMSHLARHAALDSTLHARLARAVDRRHAALSHSTALNEELFDALLLLAAGSWEPADIGNAHDAVTQLLSDMHQERERRLRQLGFSAAEAETLASLHTKNFM